MENQNKRFGYLSKINSKPLYNKYNEDSNRSLDSVEDSDEWNSLFDNLLRSNEDFAQERQTNPSFNYRMSTEKILLHNEAYNQE